jgi:hypothetical protein
MSVIYESPPWVMGATFVLTTSGDGAGTSLHHGWNAICHAVIEVHYHNPDPNQIAEIIERFTDWENWENAADGNPWYWQQDYEDGAVSVQRVTVYR